MSRIEGNRDLMDRLPRTYSGSEKEIELRTRINILEVLQDISVSLACIADSMRVSSSESDNDAHTYVRDKLMIDWFLKYYIPTFVEVSHDSLEGSFNSLEKTNVEEVYAKWMNDMGGKLDGE